MQDTIIFIIFAAFILLTGAAWRAILRQRKSDKEWIARQWENIPAMDTPKMNKKEYGVYGRITGLFRKNNIKLKKRVK